MLEKFLSLLKSTGNAVNCSFPVLFRLIYITAGNGRVCHLCGRPACRLCDRPACRLCGHLACRLCGRGHSGMEDREGSHVCGGC